MSYFRLLFKQIKELEGCKNKQRALLKKIFEPLICIWECIKCFPALSPEAFQNAWYKAYNSHLKQTPRYRPPAGKIKMLTKMSNCKKSPCRVLFGAPLCIPADNSYPVICGAKISVRQLNRIYFINCEKYFLPFTKCSHTILPLYSPAGFPPFFSGKTLCPCLDNIHFKKEKWALKIERK